MCPHHCHMWDPVWWKMESLFCFHTNITCTADSILTLSFPLTCYLVDLEQKTKFLLAPGLTVLWPGQARN